MPRSVSHTGHVFLYVEHDLHTCWGAHVAFTVFEPATLPEALGLLANEGDASAALAGGTDLLLRIRRGVRKYRSVVNIKFVPGLTGVTWDEQRGLTMGALTTFRTIEKNEHVRQ